MAGGWFKTYAPGTPVRLVANIEENNRIRNILNDIQGIGCRIVKPRDANGLGWKIVVDGGTDLDPIPDSDVGADTGKLSFKPYDIKAYGVPSGAIVMWAGNAAPPGWVICDGSNGTPDLRGKFIAGRLINDTDFASVGTTGGAKTHTHDSHSYDFTHQHSLTMTGSVVDTNAGGTAQLPENTTSDAEITGTFSHSSTKALPPYYTLVFIMKL